GPLSCDEVPNRFGARNAAEYDAAVRRADSLAGRGAFAQRVTPAFTVRGAMERVQKAGARGVILISLDNVSPQAMNTALTTRNAMRPSEASGSLPGIAMSTRAAEQMFGGSLSMLQAGAAGKPISGSWSYSWKQAEWAARNVVAILPGSDPTLSSEYVLVGAHN